MEKKDRKERVIKEIKKRAREGRPLNSGANRDGWVYSAAIQNFGSWGNAISAAGFSYKEIHQRMPLDKNDIIEAIKARYKKNQSLHARDNSRLKIWTKKYFRSWREALETAGVREYYYRLSSNRVLDEIRKRYESKKPLNTMAVIREYEPLYVAARRRFGNWKKAREKALGKNCKDYVRYYKRGNRNT